MKHHFITLGLLGLLTTAVAEADTAYRWTDKNGRTIYGGKPPAGARNVEAISPKTFSRYSSSKLIKGYGLKPSVSSKVEPVSPPIKEEKIEAPQNPEPRPTHDIDIPEPAQLDHGVVETERNDKGQLTKCAVKVKNYGGEKAGAIKISFQFPDGTLVQGTGPESLAAGAESDYLVPAANLPIILKNTTMGEPAKSDVVVPEVLLDFNSLPN